MTTGTPRLFQDGTLRSISREELADLPIRRYEGDVRLALTSSDIEYAMEDIRNETIVGLDTETRPAFRKGESHLPCLVQVATARTVYLFPLRRPGRRFRNAWGGDHRGMGGRAFLSRHGAVENCTQLCIRRS